MLKARITSVQNGRDSANVNYEIFDDKDPSTVLESSTASANTVDDVETFLRERAVQFQRVDTVTKELLALEGTVIDLS